jgi:hypothetical protein
MVLFPALLAAVTVPWRFEPSVDCQTNCWGREYCGRLTSYILLKIDQLRGLGGQAATLAETSDKNTVSFLMRARAPLLPESIEQPIEHHTHDHTDGN